MRKVHYDEIRVVADVLLNKEIPEMSILLPFWSVKSSECILEEVFVLHDNEGVCRAFPTLAVGVFEHAFDLAANVGDGLILGFSDCVEGGSMSVVMLTHQLEHFVLHDS